MPDIYRGWMGRAMIHMQSVNSREGRWDMGARDLRPGARVSWHAGQTGMAYGQVLDRYEKPVLFVFDNVEAIREATVENPAYLIEQADGSLTLLSASELDVDRDA